jgi:hypothetical protein
MTSLIRSWKQFVSKVQFYLIFRIDDEERNFSNVLLVHQSLGEGVLKEVGNSQERPQKKLEKRILEIVSSLFPEGRNIKGNLHELMERAIDLANLLTVERCLFFCTMISRGATFNPEEMQHFDDGDGEVTMCMFPAFGLIVQNEGRTERKILVKADVELDG